MTLWARVKIALTAFAIWAVFLIIPSFFLMIAMAVTLPDREGIVPSVVQDLFTVAGSIAAISVIAGRFRKKGIFLTQAAGFAPREMDGQTVCRMLAAGIGCGLALSALLSLFPFPARWMESYDVASLAAFENEGKIVAVLIAVLFMPFSEELIFRGFLLRTLLKGFSPKVSVVTVALIFGLMHGHPFWMVYAFLCGLLLGWLALRFENVTAPMLLHMGVNISALPGIFLRSNPGYIRVVANPFLLLIFLILGGSGAVLMLTEGGKRVGMGFLKGRMKSETEERYRPKHVKKRVFRKND
jgi:membrane protease YdiL (CAAX protease family)